MFVLLVKRHLQSVVLCIFQGLNSSITIRLRSIVEEAYGYAIICQCGS